MADQIVVEIDSSEETQVAMDEQVSNNPSVQDAEQRKDLKKNPNPMSTMPVVDPPDYQTTPPKETSNISRQLGASIGKKHSVVPITIPMEDMVSKCLGKISKPKKLKTKAMMEVDDETRHWVAKVAKPILDKDP